jgi:hypothetical protein
MSMRKISIFTILLASFFLFGGSTSPMQSENSAINNAIKKGNSRDLSRHFNNSIDLLIPGNEGTYSKAQAEIIVGKFFKSNPPKSFTVSQEENTPDRGIYTIGRYMSTNSKTYRVYYLTKKVGPNYRIQRLQFE